MDDMFGVPFGDGDGLKSKRGIRGTGKCAEPSLLAHSPSVGSTLCSSHRCRDLRDVSIAQDA